MPVDSSGPGIHIVGLAALAKAGSCVVDTGAIREQAEEACCRSQRGRKAGEMVVACCTPNRAALAVDVRAGELAGRASSRRDTEGSENSGREDTTFPMASRRRGCKTCDSEISRADIKVERFERFVERWCGAERR